MAAATHTHFFQVEAKDHFELGVLLGEKFRTYAQAMIRENQLVPDWSARQERSRKLLDATKTHFPHYVEELEGYAKGAHVDFLDLWTMSLEDEVHQGHADKCTTIITNDGKLIAHNEDWGKDTEDNVCILAKKIGKTRIFELYYLNTLGGNSISVNSHGFVTAVNTLVHSERTAGIPRNVIARWLSETKNPEEDFLRLQKLPRSLGFSFNIVNSEGRIWNIEYNSARAMINSPSSPYVHTNHYLSELRSNELNDNSGGSFDRYDVACSLVKPRMTAEELMTVTNDVSRGSILSIMNEKTIAKMVIDTKRARAMVWLRRESAAGWVEYPLDTLLSD